jgi:hypothetical protein
MTTPQRSAQGTGQNQASHILTPKRRPIIVTEQHRPSEKEKMGEIDRRDSFLLQMYSQLWNNINRHLTVIWQSVGVLGGSMAVLALAEKNVLPIDYAISVIVTISAWLVAHSYDASNWFNRNQTLIVNIERQFLKKSDLHDIHPYFMGHRKPGDMLTHVKIQQALGIGIALLFLFYHFTTQVLPGIERAFSRSPICRALVSLLLTAFTAHGSQKLLPYVITIIALFLLYRLRRHATQEEDALSRQAPGKSDLL